MVIVIKKRHIFEVNPCFNINYLIIKTITGKFDNS